MDIFFKNGNRYIDEVIRPLLPNAQLGSFLCYGNDIKFNLFGPGHLDNSIYSREFNSNSNLLHFTSVTNLFHIIREKKIRMSDFNLFQDEMEFYFGQNTVTKKDNKNIKSNLFALSFCEYSKSILANDFMWDKYGRQHQGVCIKIKIHKDKGFFNDFYLSKILYQDENKPIDELVMLKKRHDAFKLKYDWAISNLDEILFSVYSMYKREEPYKNEKEVRLLKYIEKQKNVPHDATKYPIRYLYNERTETLNYFYEITLEDENQNTPNPFISIEEIILGKKLCGNTLGNLVNIIKSEFKKKFGRKPSIDPLFWT